MIERPATEDGPANSSAADEWPVVPGYEILDELGRGGMGVVYKARSESLRRLVALKLIRDSALAGSQERARFKIEAEAAARMRHPNIVEIHEIGAHHGRPWFAMELVDGGSLDRRLEGRPQDPRQAAELIRTLALAVHHAHAQKVIHRDLKPANILLLSSGALSREREKSRRNSRRPKRAQLSALVPKITDFGLAKRLDSQSTAWTMDGAIIGTARYMAPEQAAGRVGELGPAADQYSLGAILYELLIGHPPFQGDSWNDVVQQVLHAEPAPPTRLDSHVPRDLESICLKCLEKDPARRYPGAADLADDLGRFLERRPVTAEPLGPRERLARLAARDGFEIVDEIGRGPRSTVYRALTEPLRQPVALKVFEAGICTREAWEARLRAGSELAAALTHPQLVLVQRAGWWDGSPWVAIEHVPQGSLTTNASGGTKAVRRALNLVAQLAEIVAYLHRQGVTHGNLKPGNVLMAASGIPRIVDFHPTGAHFQGAQRADESRTDGLVYRTPEWIENPAAELRPYTDVYGLGILLYEMLTGRPPFAAETAPELLEKIRTQDPARPSQFNADVPAGLDALCLKCLRKNPYRRYIRVYDLAAGLRHLQRKFDGDNSPRRPTKRKPA